MSDKTSDLRYQKSAEAMRAAYLELALEKGSTDISVSELARRANVNRMTFYSHYETVDDVLREYIAGVAQSILEACSMDGGFDIERFFKASNEAMYSEIEFFRMVAKDDRCAACRPVFRNAFYEIIHADLEATTQMLGSELQLMSDMLASSITYAYLDWLSGKYSDLSLESMVDVSKRLFEAAIGDK